MKIIKLLKFYISEIIGALIWVSIMLMWLFILLSVGETSLELIIGILARIFTLMLVIIIVGALITME